MKKLPIGQQDFGNLMQDNSIYVDKTAYIHKLLDSGGRAFFLSRPRRFGKSLLLSTIKAIFEGKKELFKGLYIEDKIDWQPHPVMMLDMTKDAESTDILKRNIADSLTYIAQDHQLVVEYRADSPASMLEQVIRKLYHKTGKQVVVLVDEYEKPILDAIGSAEKAVAIRQVLQTFYGVLKATSAYIRFLMLTGVTKISQTSVFSGLNHYEDLTLHPDYAGICGYTQQELEDGFDGYVDMVSTENGLSKTDAYKKIREMYNGYSWDGKTFVYNPFSVLRMFSERDFGAYWFATGTPTFLIRLLGKFDDFSPVLEDVHRARRNFDDKQTLENMQLVPLFFQTGYLTIKERLRSDPDYQYVLKMPNQEVRIALLETLVTYFVKVPDNTALYQLAKNLKAAFATGDTGLAVEYLRTLYSHAAYHQGVDNEGYYHNLFEIFCKFAGMDILIESRTDIGRIDSVLRFEDRTYIIEIKYASSPEGLQMTASEALSQIRKNNYIQPYLHQGQTAHLLGLAFTRGAIGYEEELAG